MCSRYTLHHDSEVLALHFSVPFQTVPPRYNVAPTEHVRFIFSNADEQRQEGGARWGLVPHSSKTGTTDMPLLNACSETVLEKPAFRGAFIRGRCLVPASGWYEWKRNGGGKQPCYLKPRTGEPLAFAGPFDAWRGEGDTRLVSCTVLTTAASDDLTWLHKRAPVVLDYDHYDLWLDRSTPDITDLSELFQPYPVAELEVYPVSPTVNRAGIDMPELIKGESATRA